jgi:hypothetical protein
MTAKRQSTKINEKHFLIPAPPCLVVDEVILSYRLSIVYGEKGIKAEFISIGLRIK